MGFFYHDAVRCFEHKCVYHCAISYEESGGCMISYVIRYIFKLLEGSISKECLTYLVEHLQKTELFNFHLGIITK